MEAGSGKLFWVMEAQRKSFKNRKKKMHVTLTLDVMIPQTIGVLLILSISHIHSLKKFRRTDERADNANTIRHQIMPAS